MNLTHNVGACLSSHWFIYVYIYIFMVGHLLSWWEKKKLPVSLIHHFREKMVPLHLPLHGVYFGISFKVVISGNIGAQDDFFTLYGSS